MTFKELLAITFGRADSRGRAWYDIARRESKRNGFHVYQRHMVWKDQPYFRSALERAKGVAGIPDPRCFVLQSCLRSLAGIEGDVAECGVRQGRSTIFLLAADLRDRRYHLFDSFQGLPQLSKDDRSAVGETHWKAGDLLTDEALARRNLQGFGNVEFHVGWIPETLGAASGERFAFVHIDVDLYEPTRDALSFFYERLLPGGMIVCDDYGSAHCPGARKAFDEFFAGRSERLIELPTGQAIVTKRL